MYAPWWISHGVSLFWTFAVQGDRRAAGSAAATGARLAARYLAFSGIFHLWQSLRAVRFDLLERAAPLRPYERRAAPDVPRDLAAAARPTGRGAT